jgi:hypothetical protein
MKTKKTAFVFFLSIILNLNLAFASLQDVPYKFDNEKVSASRDAFHFLRSFVDYYYSLIAANKTKLNISRAANFSGWCVGDAHAENFGVLIQRTLSPLFTMNDMDDAGPCPVAYDFLRFIVSSRLYLPNIDINAIYSAYEQGLLGRNIPMPMRIQDMLKQAASKGIAIEQKKLDGVKLKRKDLMMEVSRDERSLISDELESLFRNENLKVLDMVMTSKIGGGSGGLLRYEILCVTGNQLIQLELKELVAPAIAVIATSAIPEQAERMKTALEINQGHMYSQYYNVLKMGGRSLLLRPKFSGNLGVDLSQSSPEENIQVILYEAFVLGRIHAETVQAGTYLSTLTGVTAKELEEDIVAFTTLFNKQYDLQKNNLE